MYSVFKSLFGNERHQPEIVLDVEAFEHELLKECCRTCCRKNGKGVALVTVRTEFSPCFLREVRLLLRISDSMGWKSESELALLLPETSLEDAKSVANDLLKLASRYAHVVDTQVFQFGCDGNLSGISEFGFSEEEITALNRPAENVVDILARSECRRLPRQARSDR